MTKFNYWKKARMSASFCVVSSGRSNT